jgi:beta-lysine 5,6-aminomutase alpha subunit
MLNDSMYGILFRDINMYRTFVDQHFSRMINGLAGIIINTGEDNYLTTSDAYEKAYTVLASQFINERFALNAGLKPGQIGLGHAFEMAPDLKNAFLFELAQAQMAKEIFPDCPLKYMPPTRYMTGDIFTGHVMDAMFNFVSKATDQSIHLVGMPTEGIHTPFMQDRFLALKNARYVMNSMSDFYEEVRFKENGLVVSRAKDVLEKAVLFLEEVAKSGLFSSLEEGKFAEIKRGAKDGKGYQGVFKKSPSYWNPVEDYLKKQLGSEK